MAAPIDPAKYTPTPVSAPSPTVKPTPLPQDTPAPTASIDPVECAPIPVAASSPNGEPTPLFPNEPTPAATQQALLKSPTDYDSDGDGLIEVATLEQLDAIRHDIDGNGLADTGSDSEAYAAAFPGVAAAKECEGCVGYELSRSLDFRDPDSYATGEINPEWTSGNGWPPIAPHFIYGRPTDTSRGFKAVFDGNGHTISNLYVKRILTPTDEARIGEDERKAVGFFGVVDKTGILRRIGMVDVDIQVANYEDSGGLVGINAGHVEYSFVTGSVTGVYGIGGLTGENEGTILASYATAGVTGEAMVGGLSGYNAGVILAGYSQAQVLGRSEVAGLVGYNHGEILASLATGAASSTEGYEWAGGLVGASLGTVVAGYWDTEVSGQTSSIGSGYRLGISGFTTSELQQPTQATGIYALWGSDIDNSDGDYNLNTGKEDFWDFGNASQYPALKVDFNGDGIATWWEFGDQGRDLPSPLPPLTAELTPAPTPITPMPVRILPRDNDSDRDGLIEIHSLEQLDAIRYDLDGDGVADEDSHAAAYAAAFPTDSEHGLCEGECYGYELSQSMDFREESCYASGVVNESWTTGSGWLPIGSDDMSFRTLFDGNGHSISGLFINRRTMLDSPHGVGLFRETTHASAIQDARLVDVNVTGLESVGGLVGHNNGHISNSHVHGNISSIDSIVGGLAGVNDGEIEASSSHGDVLSGWQRAGGLIGRNGGRIRTSYAAGSVLGGGIAGGLLGSNTGSVEASYATGDVSSGSSTGGLAGSNGGSMQSVFATGNVCGGRSTGGLVGWNSVRAAISDSYATGNVVGIDGVGGLLGWNASPPIGHSGPPGKVAASYSIGAVSGVESVGGLIGSNSGDVSNSLWDSETTGQDTAGGRGEIDGARRAITAELQSAGAVDGIFSNWSVDRWAFDKGQYPALKADMDGDGTATWQEFGRQSRAVPAPAPEVNLGGVKPGFFPPQGPPSLCDTPNPPTK